MRFIGEIDERRERASAPHRLLEATVSVGHSDEIHTRRRADDRCFRQAMGRIRLAAEATTVDVAADEAVRVGVAGRLAKLTPLIEIPVVDEQLVVRRAEEPGSPGTNVRGRVWRARRKRNRGEHVLKPWRSALFEVEAWALCAGFCANRSLHRS